MDSISHNRRNRLYSQWYEYHSGTDDINEPDNSRNSYIYYNSNSQQLYRHELNLYNHRQSDAKCNGHQQSGLL